MPAVLAGCLLAGQVVSPQGDPYVGVRVVLPGPDSTLQITGPAGAFSVDAPAGADAEVLVEFWRDDRFLATATLRCGVPTTVYVSAVPLVLDRVEVSAPPVPRVVDTDVVRTTSMNRDEVERAAGPSPSVAQAVQQLPGIGAVGRDGFTSAPTIRGMGRDRSLVLIEGLRLSSDRGVGPSASFLDPFLVEEVRVVRGTAGSRYGSGAIGGAILLGLPDAPDRPGAAARIDGATGGQGRAVAVRAGGPLGGGWRAAAGGFYRAQEDYDYPAGDGGAAGEAFNSGLTQGGGLLILDHDAGGGSWRFTLLGTSADDVGRPTTKPDRLDTIADETHAAGTVRFRVETDDRLTEAAFGVHRPRTLNRTRRFDDEGVCTRTGEIENVSWDFSLAGRQERVATSGRWSAGADLFTRGGVNATESAVRFTGGVPGSQETVNLLEDGVRWDVGGFVGWRRPVRILGEVAVAARLDWAHRGARGQPDASWTAPSFDARAVVPLDTRWAATAALGWAFRAPRIQELYYEGDRPGGARQANPGLDPERAWAAEAGIRWGVNGWTASISGWAMRANDLIVQLPVSDGSDTLRYENLIRGRLLGVEAEVGWSPEEGRVAGSLAYAYVHGEDAGGRPLPDVPSAEVRIRGEYRWPGPAEGTAWITLRAGAAKTPVPGGVPVKWWSNLLGATAVGGDEQGHPGYARWDLGAEARVGAGFTVGAAITNLFDSRYLDRPEPDAFPQPGRSVGVRLGLEF